MLPSQLEFESLLQRLREQQTESSTKDGKENFFLKTEGDRAYFIRHVAALANNVEPSYLIIGVEDRTWNPIGLPEDSSLRQPDRTQQRMNQVLANRLDPNLSIRYRTYKVSGVVYGLVAIEGTSAPYIVAIEDQQYGGDRTQASPGYIYRGAIYIRRGASSLIANRQSEVLGIVERSQQVAADGAQPDEFLVNLNYIDVESETFGHHSLTKSLVEFHVRKETFGGEHVTARSWVSFVLYPASSGCEIDPIGLKENLKPDRCIGRGPEWYRRIPEPFVRMLYTPRATPREFIARWHPSNQDDDEITHFIRIRPSGHMEIACTAPLFLQGDGVRVFRFVNLIGYLWQMIYLSRAIYHDASFYGESTVLVNLIGTKGTRLADFAESQRGGWAPPFSFGYIPSKQDVYQEKNIQVKRTFLLTEASDEEIGSVVRDIAGEIGAYYGQDRPKCFDRCTHEFPVRQYTTRT